MGIGDWPPQATKGLERHTNTISFVTFGAVLAALGPLADQRAWNQDAGSGSTWPFAGRSVT